MKVERAEAAGLGVALVLHGALLWALGLRAAPEPAPPAMEVSFVEEYGRVSGAPATEPAAQSVAPETGPPEAAAPIPQPTPSQIPQPAPSPQQPRQAGPSAAAPPSRAAPQPQQQRRQGGAGTAPSNRGTRLGPDFLKGIGNDPAARSQQPAGATMTARARADIGAMIVRQVQPCANRQRNPGPGAERIRVTIRLRLNPDGSLAGQPTVIARDGVDETNRRYLALVEENTINSFTLCSPLRGLPADLYDVPRGWRDFNLRYRLPG